MAKRKDTVLVSPRAMQRIKAAIDDVHDAAFAAGLRKAAAIARAHCTCPRRRKLDCLACQVAEAIEAEPKRRLICRKTKPKSRPKKLL